MGEIIKILFSLWLYPTISFLLFTILLFNEFVRKILNIILWLKYKGKVFIVSDGIDAVWEYRTPGNTRMVLVCLSTKRGQLNNARGCAKIIEERLFGNIKGKINNNLEEHKFQHIITRMYGYTCWKQDTNFHVRRHIRTLDKDFEYTEKDVMNLLSELTNDMDEFKPQWEWVLLPKYIDAKGEKKSLQIFRFHHAYMDGMSGLMLISKLSDNFKYSLDPMKFKISLWKKIYIYINCILFGPITLFRMYHNKYQTYWNRRRSRNPRVRGRKFLAWTNNTIDLDILKRIQFDTKTSISTIVSFAFVEACKIVLHKKRLVKEMRVSEVIAFFPYPNSNPQNRFTAFTYGIDLENNHESIIQRLRNTQKNSLDGIKGPEPLVIYYVAKLAGRFPYHILPYIYSGANSSIHLSNVPCAKERFQYFNAECEEFAAFPPLPNDTGLGISSLSYNGGLKICGQADASCLSENELSQIFNEIPKIIYSMAEYSMPTPVFPTLTPVLGSTSDEEIMSTNSNGQKFYNNNLLPENKITYKKSEMNNNRNKSPCPSPSQNKKYRRKIVNKK